MNTVQIHMGFLYYNSIEDLKFLIKTSGINIKLFIRELNTISIYWLKKNLNWDWPQNHKFPLQLLSSFLKI